MQTYRPCCEQFFRSEKVTGISEKVQTYMGIASAVTASIPITAPAYCRGATCEPGGTLIQYQETDWRFLKKNGVPAWASISADTAIIIPAFTLDCRKVKKGNWEKSFPVISVLMRYYAVSGKCLVDREDFICYDVVTRTSLSLGDRVTYEGRELLVSRKKQNWQEVRSSLQKKSSYII